jgi:hypothetical protein
MHEIGRSEGRETMWIASEILDPMTRHDPVVETAMQVGENEESEREANESPSLQSHRITSLESKRNITCPEESAEIRKREDNREE